MQQIIADRRTWDRRCSRAGGRRMTDQPLSSPSSPVCPNCQQNGVAVLAGEAEGGWWFVCLDCDHLWDQRQTVTAAAGNAQPIDREDAYRKAMALAPACRRLAVVKSWWKHVCGRGQQPAQHSSAHLSD